LRQILTDRLYGRFVFLWGWGQIVTPLVIHTEGGPQKSNCADLAGVLRVIQSIPSKKAEPFKMWMAQVAAEGGGVARTARMELEAKTGKGVISPENARAVLDGRMNPELPFDEEEG